MIENEEESESQLRRVILAAQCEKDHLFFVRLFFKARQNLKFIVNWHHRQLCDVVQDVIAGKLKKVVINVPPGSSKTEIVVINFIARGLALNPWCRFLHLSTSDSLALQNSDEARGIVRSAEFQELWPLEIADDADSKKRWNVMVGDKKAGGVYATSMGGQVTGFRAGHMAPGFQGAILIDDPLKPEDSFSKTKTDAANRKLLTTVNSRKANPDTPIVVIMQRVSEHDTSAFIMDGNLGDDWTFIKIPALLTPEYVNALSPRYHKMMTESEPTDDGRVSYWPYKEPAPALMSMARGEGRDEKGNRMSRYVYAAQYDQNPVSLGGNVIKSNCFVRYRQGVLPKLVYRKIYADTAQKDKEHNDFSVFACWGKGVDGKIYLLDLIRGKWQSPELKKRARAFWAKHKSPDVYDPDVYGELREMMVEDKASGTDVIQTLGTGEPGQPAIPVQAVQRTKDKYTRVQDVIAYIEIGLCAIPEDAPFTSDFLEEHEAFKADDTHDHDDQVDTTVDAIMDMLSNENNLNIWERLGNSNG